jgi:hypothetical protein
MTDSDTFKQSTSTVNSRLLPTKFAPPQLRHGTRKILEPHGSNRRPKTGNFKLLTAYVAAYIGVLIPHNTYKTFVDRRGERV